MEPLVIDATADVDIETRQLGFAALQGAKHPRLRQLALEQLADPDPAARLIGLQSLRTIATTNDVAIAMHLLNDSEPRVAVAAALVLRQATGEDFGIKSTHAIPQFTCLDTNPPPAPDLAAITQGVRSWQQWWTQHQLEYPPQLVSPPQCRSVQIETPDFTLATSAGKPVQLSQFRGRTVLLAFWSPGSPASLDDVPALLHIQQRSAGLAVLGICVPAAPGCGEETGHGNEHAHHHHAAAASAQTSAEMSSLVQNAAERLQIGYPMLVDAKGKLSPRFRADDLPVYVLIDSQGRLRRRCVGFRSEQALSAMVEEVSGPQPNPARLSASRKLD